MAGWLWSVGRAVGGSAVLEAGPDDVRRVDRGVRQVENAGQLLDIQNEAFLPETALAVSGQFAAGTGRLLLETVQFGCV